MLSSLHDELTMKMTKWEKKESEKIESIYSQLLGCMYNFNEWWWTMICGVVRSLYYNSNARLFYVYG